MKKCTIKKTKRYTRKGKKKKMTDVHLQRKESPRVSQCTKHIVALVKIGSVLLCLNFSIISLGFK